MGDEYQLYELAKGDIEDYKGNWKRHVRRPLRIYAEYQVSNLFCLGIILFYDSVAVTPLHKSNKIKAITYYFLV